ncbi:MAG: Ig-like domain-containing protein [Clostridia bacterium]|nr:Ig-like domain-containing protein [Clostridia bacterium]
MKHISKNISLVLAIVLTISVFAGLSVNAATVQSLPYLEDFSGGSISADRGWTASGDNLSVTDGKVKVEDVWENNDNNRKLVLDFSPVNTGVLVFEADMHIVALGNVDFISMNGSDGKKLFAAYADGRGANGTYVNEKKYVEDAALNTQTTNFNWGGSGVQDFNIKVEVDFDNDVWRFYQGYNGNMNQLKWLKEDTASGKVGGDFPFIASGASDAAQLTISLARGQTTLDNVRVYKKVEATQTETLYTMNVDSTQQAGIVYAPAGTTMADMVWSSSDTSVATVTSTGLITTYKPGYAEISATSAFYNVDFKYDVKVVCQSDKMTIDQADRVIYTDESFRLTYSVPAYSTVGNVTWSSNNENIAKVSQSGVVTGVSEGSAIITATGENNVSASCGVEVVAFDSSKKAISITNSGFDYSLYGWVGDSYDTADAKRVSGGANGSAGCLKLTEKSYVSTSIKSFETDTLYTLSYMLKIDSLEPDSFAFIELESSEIDGIASVTHNEVTNGWKRVCVDFVIPKGTTEVGLLLRMNGKGAVYYDDVVITKQKDITEVRLFSDGLALNSVVKDAPLTTASIYYNPKVSNASELIVAVYEDEKLVDYKSTPVTGEAEIITDLIDLSKLNEKSTVGVMNWDGITTMNPYENKRTFLEKTQRSEAYNFFEINRMRGLYGGSAFFYDDSAKSLIQDKGINTIIFNIIGDYDGENISTNMNALSKFLDDAEVYSDDMGVKIFPKISYGAGATISNTKHGEFSPGYQLTRTTNNVVTNITSKLPCPRAREYWDEQVTDVLSVIAKHKKLPGGVIDFEMYGGYSTSYGASCKCDRCASDFDKAYGTNVLQQNLTARKQYLIDNKLYNKYDAWHKSEITQITTEVREVIHAINPDFIIGCMPTYEWITGTTEGLGTKRMPLMVFDEHAYRGDMGYLYFDQAKIRYMDLPAVYATGLWSTKNTNTTSYIAPESFAAKAVEAAENSMGYWVYSYDYLAGSQNTAEENAAYINAVKSANDTIDNKYGL